MTTNPTSRRDFLTVGSLGFLGLTLRDTLAAAAASPAATAKANSVILFWLEGGPSHIDTWDPKPNSNFKPISTNVAGIQVSELLPKIAKRMDKFALVRSMHTRGNDHPQATHYAITGHEINPAMQFPSLGSIITKELGPRNAVPPHVLVPKWDRGRQYEDYFRAAFLGGEYDPMCIPDPSKPDFAGHRSQPAEDRLGGVGREPLGIPEGGRSPLPRAQRDGRACQHGRLHRAGLEDDPHARGARRLRSVEGIRQDEGAVRQGLRSDQSLLLARRLVEAGSRFVTAAGYHSTSWDTHSDNDKGHRDRLAPPLDRTLTALVDDLEERGLLETTLVIAMGEFGRTPFINAESRPRSLAELLVARARGRRDQDGAVVVGASDERGANVTDRVVTMGDLYATIYKLLGIDWTQGVHEPDRTARQDRQLARRPDRRACGGTAGVREVPLALRSPSSCKSRPKDRSSAWHQLGRVGRQIRRARV